MRNPWRESERRKTVRISASIKVRYKVVGPHQRQYPSLSMDISGAGIGVLMDERLKEGQDLELEMDLPSQPRSIACKGEVVWVKEVYGKGRRNFATGIKFTKMAPEDTARLYNAIYGPG